MRSDITHLYAEVPRYVVLYIVAFFTFVPNGNWETYLKKMAAFCEQNYIIYLYQSF
jgi:hypothetical protein